MNRREALAGYLFISPWIVGFLVFTLGAMIYSLVISFNYYNLAKNTMRPAGLDNYAALFDDPKVLLSLKNTLFYAVLAVPLEICFALFLALLLNRVGRGAGVFRTLYYLPKMTPAVATASVFFLLLNGNTGAINKGLGADRHRGTAVADRPGLGQAVDRADDPVGGQRHHGDLPGGAEERAARALRGRLARRGRAGLGSSSASPCR